MKPARTYLDHNASAPLREEARAAMVSAMAMHGNPSSVHAEGRQMKALIEKARREVAALVGADPEGVVFTGSATEAAHLALTPDISSDGVLRQASHLYVLATEHPCILAGGRFNQEQITTVPVLTSGLIDEKAFETLLENHDFSMGVPYLALQLVNSETGVIQPVQRIAQKVRMKGGYVLCDAVQAAGRIPIDVAELAVDFLILSAHKIGGPQGIGAMIKAHSILDFNPVISGGGQEMNRRAGTENVTGISGFGAAATLAAQDALDYGKITGIRDSIESRLTPICAANGVSIERLNVFGEGSQRVGNTILFSVAGLKAETALIAFDLDGCAVSSGSACSSGKVGRSHVLAAMGVNEEQAQGAIRVSLGWSSTEADAERFLVAFERLIKRLGVAQNREISGAA